MDESGNGNGGNGERGPLPGFEDLSVQDFSRDSEYWEEQEALLSELEETVRSGEVSAAAAERTRKGRRGKQLVKKDPEPRHRLTAVQKMLALDVWKRSGLTAGDFAPLLGVSRHSLYVWKRDFKRHGPEGLSKKRRPRSDKKKVSEVTKRAILLLKDMNPDHGCLRISQQLKREDGLGASEAQVRRVLLEFGYELVEQETKPRNQKPLRFERARANQLWQTDLFTFKLQRQNRRVYLVAYLDDHSRYVVGFGLNTSATTADVLGVLTDAIANYGPPEEVLTDNGPQFNTWRGTSRYTKELRKLGIKQIIARPKRPQTLGKVERFWGTLNREFLQRAIFKNLDDARQRIGLFVDHYNFRRTHQGIDGLYPADRYFGAASEVRRMLERRIEQNALELARHGSPKKPFYLTGSVGGKTFSVHASGERMVLSRTDGEPEEIELVAPPAPEPVSEPLSIKGPQDVFDEFVDAALAEDYETEPMPPNPLDEALSQVRAALDERRIEEVAGTEEADDE